MDLATLFKRLALLPKKIGDILGITSKRTFTKEDAVSAKALAEETSPFVDTIRQGLERTAQDRPGILINKPQGRPPDVKKADEVVESVIRQGKNQLHELATKFRNGRLSDDAFEGQARTIIRRTHLGALSAGAGGLANLMPAHREALEQTLSVEFGYLKRFVQAVKDTTADSSDFNKIPSRAGSYASSAWGTYQQAMRIFISEQADGTLMEARYLGEAEHCQDCIDLSVEVMGWVPVGTLPPIGDSKCRNECRCSFRYASADEIGAD